MRAYVIMCNDMAMAISLGNEKAAEAAGQWLSIVTFAQRCRWHTHEVPLL